MHVLHVAANFPPEIGGPATQSWDLCRMQRAHGLEISVMTFGDRDAREEIEGVRIHRHARHGGGAASRLRCWTSYRARLRRLLAEERPQVVHCHDVHLHALLAGDVARRVGVPSVAKFAGDFAYEVVNARAVQVRDIAEAHAHGLAGRALAAVERWGFAKFDLLWAASEFRRRDLVDLHDVPPDRVRVIPNHVNLPAPAGVRRPPGSGPVRVACVGRFAAHKRLDRTIAAFAQLPAGSAVLEIVGGGDAAEEARVDAWIRAAGASGRITRFGKVSRAELVRVMSEAHVLLSTSEEEGFGIVFVEAMSLGLPVVALRTGGIPEVVPDGEAGFLVPPDDQQGVVEALRRLVDDPALRRCMGDAGRKAAERYDLGRNWAVFTRLYEEAIRLRREDRPR